jgi:two-component system sensor histidine kinase DegS
MASDGRGVFRRSISRAVPAATRAAERTQPRRASLMKKTRIRLTAPYRAALRAHLDPRVPPDVSMAKNLGQATLACGLATLDLAAIHEEAVVALASRYNFANARNGCLRRAGAFFTQALVPLEADRRAIRETNRSLLQRNETLRQHTAALALGNRRLEREITRRKGGEVKIESAKERYRLLFLESHVLQRKLQHLTRQIISAQEEERRKISRELHDEVVQTLVGINVDLTALANGLTAGTLVLQRKIARTKRLVEHSVHAVHRFARELRPAVLDDLGLIPALHAFSQNLAARKKIRIQITAFSGVEALTNAKRTVLYRVAQEALNNVARHAEATEVKLIIVQIPGGIRMEIGDNGKSFPVAKTLLARTNKRLGLVGMRERVEMIGGRLAIESAAGVGTTIRTEIPFKPQPKSP